MDKIIREQDVELLLIIYWSVQKYLGIIIVDWFKESEFIIFTTMYDYLEDVVISEAAKSFDIRDVILYMSNFLKLIHYIFFCIVMMFL
jgi:hypothetical protein